MDSGGETCMLAPKMLKNKNKTPLREVSILMRKGMVHTAVSAT